MGIKLYERKIYRVDHVPCSDQKIDPNMLTHDPFAVAITFLKIV